MTCFHNGKQQSRCLNEQVRTGKESEPCALSNTEPEETPDCVSDMFRLGTKGSMILSSSRQQFNQTVTQ